VPSWARRARIEPDLRELRETAALVAALPPSDTFVSVVMPTRDRAELLPRAIASVRAQSHANFELIVVDDASVDETPAVIAAIDDPRVRSLRMAEATGGSGARNAGLRAARGELVAYLDDDNLMAPLWLRAVAWAFEREPCAALLYGALVLDDGELPQVHQPRWNREHMDHGNLIDQNALAHRAGLAGAWFDEGRRYGADWELAHRLTRDCEPLRLPALAARYALDGGRVSSEPAARRAFYELSRELRARRELRVAVAGVDASGLAGAHVTSVQPWPAELPDVLLVAAAERGLRSLLARARVAGVPVVLVGRPRAPASDSAAPRVGAAGSPVIANLEGVPSAGDLRALVEDDLATRVWGLGPQHDREGELVA
jgi:hypothetical protein